MVEENVKDYVKAKIGNWDGLKEKLEETYLDGYYEGECQGHNDTIEKVVEWIKDEFYEYKREYPWEESLQSKSCDSVEELIDHFRKWMEDNT